MIAIPERAFGMPETEISSLRIYYGHPGQGLRCSSNMNILVRVLGVALCYSLMAPPSILVRVLGVALCYNLMGPQASWLGS